ncbi:MAG: hypothetical protein ACO2PO_15095, partial [Candidatus Calescibacterium sp.]
SQDQNQSSLLDEQSSITADLNRRLFFKSSHEEIKFRYAVQSCFVKLGGNFLVDGYNSFCGEYNQNQNISTGSVAYVNEIKIVGRNVNITGQVVQVQSCEVDASQIIDKARQSNNNSVIPPQFIRDGKLKLENNDKLTLPSGVLLFQGDESFWQSSFGVFGTSDSCGGGRCKCGRVMTNKDKSSFPENNFNW